MLAFWLTGREDPSMTLTDVSSTTSFTVRAYLRMQSSQDVRESTELDLWDAMVNIDTALRSDANLAGNVTDSDVGDCSVGYTEIGGVIYRTVDIPFSVQIYGEISITP